MVNEAKYMGLEKDFKNLKEEYSILSVKYNKIKDNYEIAHRKIIKTLKYIENSEEADIKYVEKILQGKTE